MTNPKQQPAPTPASSPFHDALASAAFTSEKLTKRSLHESARMFCDVYGLLPGQSQAPHAHAGSDKIYCVLEGEGRFQVGTRSERLRAGGVAVAPAGQEHAVHNDSQAPLKVLVVMAPHPKPPTA
ncbi:MAG: cupin domain-containing protein [Planctomycetota bacterium]